MRVERVRGRRVAAVAAVALAAGFGTAGAAEARTGGTPAAAESGGNAPVEVQRAMRSFWHGSEIKLFAGGQPVGSVHCVLRTAAELSEDCQDLVGEGKSHLALLGRYGADRAVVRPFDEAGALDSHPTAKWKLTGNRLVERHLPMFGADWRGYEQAGYTPRTQTYVFDSAGNRVDHKSEPAGKAARVTKRGKR